VAQFLFYAGEQGRRRLHSGFIAVERPPQAACPVRMKLLHALIRKSGRM